MIFYSTSQAADALGIEPVTVKKHYRQGHLKGTLVGHSLVFTQEDLDAFRATWKRKRGPEPDPNSVRSRRRIRREEKGV